MTQANLKLRALIVDDILEYLNNYAFKGKTFNSDGDIRQFYDDKDMLKAYTEMQNSIFYTF